MKPISRSLCVTLFSICALHSLAADMQEKGCFSPPDGFLDQGSYTWQSHAHCQEQCVKLNKPVMALGRGSDCSCGDLLPVASSKLSDSQCSKECQGFPDEKCGGDDAWSIVLTGLNSNVGSAQESNDNDSESDSDNASSNSNPAPKAAPPASMTSTSPSTTSNSVAKPKSPSNAEDAAVQPDATKDKPPSTITRTGTVVITAPGQTQPVEVSAAETTKPSKGPNTAGIAAGVVVGVVVICALAGGLFFFLRRRKRRTLEEDYQKNPVNPFETESEGKPPASSHSMSDSRLEPSVMMQRRQSDGSIADNQDYSRRILKVTNPDGT